MSELDYDWLVVGSGFGNSVAALRLTEYAAAQVPPRGCVGDLHDAKARRAPAG